MVVNGNKLYITVPKSLIGVTETNYYIDFKWTDNTLSSGDIIDFYLYGDTAPTGRFCYRYIFERE